MTVGALLLWARQKFGHGLRTAYYRDVVRPRILRTPSLTATTNKACEIHVLTSAQDWLNLIWALKSFYAASARQYALCIHEDGSLVGQEMDTLRRHFPEARIVSKAEADALVLPSLKPFPRCLEFRKTNHLAPKIFDFPHYLDSERMLLLDSDVLFFKEPTELLRRIEDRTYRLNLVNRDVASAYTVDAQTVKARLGIDLIERFNSGLGLIHRDSLRLEWIEEFLGLPGILAGHFWRIEQTLYALSSSRFGVEFLSPEYDVRLEPGIEGLPSRHYVGAIRHFFYKEGIPHLLRNCLLTKAA